MIPEIRTVPRTAIALSVGALAAIVITLTFGHQIEDALNSSTAATLVLGAWCVLGAGVAIAAVVDAYLRPDGELLGLVTTIAATVFAVASMLVVAGIVVGATDINQLEADVQLDDEPSSSD